MGDYRQHSPPIPSTKLESAPVKSSAPFAKGKPLPTVIRDVSAKWMDLHCKARGLRSVYGIGRLLRPMLHAWTGRPFSSIGRGDVTKLLDKIETEERPAPSQLLLGNFLPMANWYAASEDDYRSPIVKGMRRGTPIKRDRTLNDDELRAVWRVAEANGTFGALVRLLLLTGQRREKVASMRWEDIRLTARGRFQLRSARRGTRALSYCQACARHHQGPAEI